MKFCLINLIFFCLLSLCAEANQNFPKTQRIILRHIESGGVGYNNGYTTLGAFLSADPNLWRVTPFIDGRGHLFDNGTWAANGGIGLRSQLGKRIYGINAYYDYRGTKHLNYNQASVGFETLGTLVDARINGYLPFSRKTSDPYDTEFGYFSGHYLFLSQKVEFAMKGVDTEVGFHLGNCDSWNFYASAGPYYFRGPSGPNAWGGKIRASISYQDLVTFEVIESYDNVFHNKTQGQIGISIPLGRKNTETRTKKLYCRSLQPVARNEIVVLNHKHKYPIAINPLSNSPYYFVFVNNTSSSEGTFESPYPSLLLAQENSSPNQIIYTFPGDGTTRNMDQGITLQARQKFWGSSIPHNLQTAQGAITVPQMSIAAPQITNINLLGVGATLSINNEISGIVFTETSGQAINGTDPAELSLSSCTFIGCGQGDGGIFPVTLESSSPLTAAITKNTFTRNTNSGIYIRLLPGASSSQININNNEAYDNLANSGGVGIINIVPHDEVGVCELVVTNNIFQNNECGGCSITDFNTPHTGSFALFYGSFRGNIFTESAQGITFKANADNCILNIRDNDLSNNTNGSISIFNGDDGTQLINNAVIRIDSNQMNGGSNGGDAITINPSGNTFFIELTNNSIHNNLGTGFVSFFNQPGPNTTLLITDNMIANNQNMTSNASGGISFDGFRSVAATIRGNTLSNNVGGNSIGKNGNSFMIHPGTSTVNFTRNELTENDIFEFQFYGDNPETGCLTIAENTSTTDPAYIFQPQGTGSCFIVPCNYDTVNTGGFDTTAERKTDCAGNACP